MSGGICDYQVANLTAPTSAPTPVAAVSFGPQLSPRPAMVFYNYDHLGNTRITYTCKVDYQIGTLTKKEYTAISLFDYDPYGKVLRSYGNEKYLTTYHERDVETGLDYRGARFYDGEIYRFLSLDPLQAKYPSLSAYNYVACNPVMLVDPTGKSVDDPPKEVPNSWGLGDNTHIALNNSKTYNNTLNSFKEGGKYSAIKLTLNAKKLSELNTGGTKGKFGETRIMVTQGEKTAYCK
jgi:RHS repeat-associated protein